MDKRLTFPAVAFLFALGSTAQADKLADIRKRMEELKAEQQAAATQGDCMGPLTLLGVQMASPGGIYKLRNDHPVMVAYEDTRKELSALEGDVYRSNVAVEDAADSVKDIEEETDDLSKRAAYQRKESLENREKAAEDGVSDSSRTMYLTRAAEADEKANEYQKKIDANMQKLPGLQKQLTDAQTKQAGANAAAAPMRKQFTEISKQGEDLAAKCP